MILRRVIEHVKAQNWTAVFLDFAIVVVGVFMGMQVNNWNAARIDQIRAREYLHRIGADLDADIAAVDARLEFWRQVADYGALGLQYAEAGDAGGRSYWDIVLAYFQASQVAELVPLQATYDELKSGGELGLIGDADFRSALTKYYNFTAAATVTERPRYRENVRGVIPIEIQKYIWDKCYESNAELEQSMIDCPSPVDETDAAAIVNALAKDEELMRQLRYWMSIMHVAELIGRGRMEAAVSLRATVDELVAK